MTIMPAGFSAALQFLGQPICRSIARSSRPSALLSTDRPGGFLDGLLRSCGAGAPERISVVSARDFLGAPELGPVDGLAFADPDNLLLAGRGRPRTRFVTSLDRQGLLLPHVTAVAIGAQAGAAKAWRGATALIARDRPIFVSYAQNDPDILNDLLPFGYVVRPFVFWSAPQATTLLVAAIPAEQQGTDGEPVFLGWTETAAPVLPRPGIPVSPHLRVVVEPEALAGRGLHAFESDRDHSGIWTGPMRRSEILLPQIWVGPQTIRVTVNETRTKGGPASLAFLINGRSVQADIGGIGPAGGGDTVRADIDSIGRAGSGDTGRADIDNTGRAGGADAVRADIDRTGRAGSGGTVRADRRDADIFIRTTIPAHEFVGEFTLTIVTPDPLIPVAQHRHQRTSLGPLEISWL